MVHLRHLHVKSSPSHQDARPRVATHRAGRLRMKKEVARKAHGRKKVFLCSQHHRVKMLPSHQDTRPRGTTHRAGRPRVKKEAARRSLGRTKMLLHSPHHHVKIARHLRWGRVGTKTRLFLHDGL